MRIMKALAAVSIATTVFAARASAAVVVSFDPADSNIAAGLYDFTLSGAPSTADFANFSSTFTITGWAAPAVGNSASLISTMAPSAWNVTQNDSNNAKWILQSTSSPNNLVDGRFEVGGTPNLQGSLLWQLAWPGDNTFSSSGTVAMSVVPEVSNFGVFAALGLLGLSCRHVGRT